MSDDTPKRTIPQYIEPRKFCIKGVLLTGEIPGDGFQRLLAASAVVNRLSAELEFGIESKHRWHSSDSSALTLPVTVRRRS